MSKWIISFFVSIIATVAFAAPKALDNKFSNSRIVFEALAETFPELVEHTGNESKVISIQQLGCFSISEVIDNVVTTKTECEAMDSEFMSHRQSATNLFLVLLNQRVPVHSYSSPGKTYIILKNVRCARINTSENKPSKPLAPDYNCSARPGM